MSTAVTCLIGFAALTLLLPLVQVSYRSLLVFAGRKPANAWPRGSTPEEPAIMTRIAHAHLNCLENLPIFAAVVLAAGLLEQLAVVDPLAPWVLVLRLAQTGTHLVGTTARLVFVRALFYSGQVLLMFWMMWQLVA